VWISGYCTVYMRIQCARGGGGGYGILGLRQINTCRKVPLQVNFFRWHFALVSIQLISPCVWMTDLLCQYSYGKHGVLHTESVWTIKYLRPKVNEFIFGKHCFDWITKLTLYGIPALGQRPGTQHGNTLNTQVSTELVTRHKFNKNIPYAQICVSDPDSLDPNRGQTQVFKTKI
jgi:hypothetical protein